jgi:site-specific DNA-methyltransferase (cytosine-N4-specific)
MNLIRCKIKEYIQPFERYLALKELSILSGENVEDSGQKEFFVRTKERVATFVKKLSYWETIESKNSILVTLQSKRESTVNVVRNGIDLDSLRQILPFEKEVPLPNRRCLRYGPHGIHEYRGKFFPQLVRSLANIADVNNRSIIADPMSGSGTTIVETNLMGCKGIGLDMNPLSVFIGQVKCELLRANPILLESAYTIVREKIVSPEIRSTRQLRYFSSLPEADQEYLKNWFADDVLLSLDEVTEIINSIVYTPARNLMWVSLSNILRSVSWQKDDDLRVRKEIRMDIEIDPKKEFLEELARSVRAVLAFLYQNGSIKHKDYSIREGDARFSATIWKNHKGKIDAVITSPPYATALPYLDTDRLSLMYLGLLTRPNHRKKDHLMIGNREISDKLRIDYMNNFDVRHHELPSNIVSLIRRIEKLNNGTDAGFRRLNLPALLSKYFFDMKDVLQNVKSLLKRGGSAFLVVGNNHTIAGGQRIDILTADLLEELADQANFSIQPAISMEMLLSRDIFRKNTSESEKILVLRKK